MFYLVYSLIFQIYKLILKTTRNEVRHLWYRNSFILGYWDFLRSDIDITILIDKKNIESIESIHKTHTFFRKYIKIIGELSIYSIEDLEIISKIINPIELSRDPNLLRYLKISLPQTTTHSEKLIFASKYIVSNYNSRTKFNTRKKKKSYLEKVLSTKIESFIDLKNFIVGTSSQEISLLELYLLDKLPEKPTYSKTDAVFFNKLIHHQHPISTAHFTNDSLKIIIDLIKWEIWGCYAHSYLADKKIIKQYLDKLVELSKDDRIKLELDDLKEKAKLLDII